MPLSSSMLLLDLPADVSSLILDQLESIDLQCLRLTCTTARDLVDCLWKPLRGHTAALEVPLDEDNDQRARYALRRGLSPDLLVGELGIDALGDETLEEFDDGLYQFEHVRLVPPDFRKLGEDYFSQLGNLLVTFKAQFPGSLTVFTALTNLTLSHVDPAVDLPITRLSTLRELRIEGLHTDIPVGTWRLPELTSLTVEGEYTVYIVPDDIPATAKLRRLRLSCEDDDFVLDYHALPANLWGLRELFHFDCDVRLDGIPDGFSQLTGLTSLTLSPFHCVDYLMPDHFSCLSNLQCLSLRGIPDLDGDIIEPNVKVVGTLSSLQRLDISDADVRDLGFWRLTRLTALTMVRCSNGLHPSIGELDSLQTLHLADNLDFGLPDEISCLSALTNLHISDDNVLPFDLPMATFSLTRLRQLELSFLANNVQLPDELGQLQQLQYLQLSCGVLSASHSMTNLSRLTRIVLSAFDIDPVPSLSKLRQLREVSLHIRMLGTGYHTNHYLCRDLLSQANSVTSLALESYVAFLNPVETLTNLRALNLSLDNCRDWYLDDIASLSKLTSLELHWPNGPIPAAVFDVVSLRTLRIISAIERKLPSGISKLSNLRCLSIPEGLQMCSSVTKLKRLVRLNVPGDNKHLETWRRLARAGVMMPAQ